MQADLPERFVHYIAVLASVTELKRLKKEERLI
jgi:hypothetical protein